MKKIIGIIIIIAVLGVIIVPRVIQKNSESNAQVEETTITVEAKAVSKGNIADFTFLTGKISANKKVDVMASAPAMVEEVMVEVGDPIHEDDVLFKLDTKNLENQLKQAEAGVTSSKASIDQAKLGVTSANDSVRMAQIAYDLAKAGYDSGLEQYELAKENLVKYEKLYNEGIISQSEYDQIKLQASDATLVSLNKQLEQAAQSLEQAKRGINNATVSSRQASASLTQAQVNYDSAKDALQDMTVEAPIDGIVSAVNIIEDGFASNTLPAMTIEDIDTVKVSTNVTENIVNRIEKGQKVEVIIQSIREKPFEGTITVVSPSANAQSLLYPVTIEVDNKDHIIKPGMFALIQFKIEESQNSIVIDGGAVITKENKRYVYVLNEDEAAMLVEVEVGIDTGDFIEITKGIQEGDLYLTKGMDFITEETKLRVVRGDE